MRSEFERNRYWIGLYRTDVYFNEDLGMFGMYVCNGSRDIDDGDLARFNEKWEAYANAWHKQQEKIDHIQNNFKLFLALQKSW